MSKQTIDTGTEDCLFHLQDNVAVITLNRPQARNAMSGPMTAALDRALDHAERSAEVRCVVITGAGGAFCAGGDVKGMASGGDGGAGAPSASLDERIHAQRLNQRNTAGRIHLMPKPVIASLPGAAAGAGPRWGSVAIMAAVIFCPSWLAREKPGKSITFRTA